MAGHGAHRFAVIEIVGKLFACVFLPGNHLGVHLGFVPQFFAQHADQFGIFGKLFHQNGTRAVECGFAVGHLFVEIILCGGFGIGVLFGQQQIGQGLQTVFAGDLRFGAALGFVGQIDVFERGFVVASVNRGLQFRRELALLFYAFEHGFFTRHQLAQIAQTLFQRAQLAVV